MIKCGKCGVKFVIIVIDNDKNGYRCKNCLTVHSWIDGKPLHITSRNLYNVRLGSKYLRGGERR